MTGLSSIRLDVSAALRMSASPMVRTASAWCANSGLRAAVLVSATMNPSTLASSSGTSSGATWGAIAGACVATTAAGAGGAVRVSDACGGSSGAGAAAACSPGPVLIGFPPTTVRVRVRVGRRYPAGGRGGHPWRPGHGRRRFLGRPRPLVPSSAVACPSGLRSTPRKRVWVQAHRGFKSHRHRHGPSTDRGPIERQKAGPSGAGFPSSVVAPRRPGRLLSCRPEGTLAFTFPPVAPKVRLT